jgi:hypothetical protein
VQHPTNSPTLTGKKRVALRTLIQRINRKLHHEGEALKMTRGDRCRNGVGDFYIVDWNRARSRPSMSILSPSLGRSAFCAPTRASPAARAKLDRPTR